MGRGRSHDSGGVAGRCRRAVRERGRQPVLQQLRVVSRKQRPCPPGTSHRRPQADDTRTHPRGDNHRFDADGRGKHQRHRQTPDCGMGRRPEAGCRFDRRGREDAEHVCESSAGTGIERARVERLGRRLPQLAVPAWLRCGTVSWTSVATAIEMGVRVSWRYGVVRPNDSRRAALRNVECRSPGRPITPAARSAA